MTIDNMIFAFLGAIVGAFIFMLIISVCVIQERDDEGMSDNYRTKEEYIKRHASDYCNGDTEEAKEHAIVKEVLKEKEE